MAARVSVLGAPGRKVPVPEGHDEAWLAGVWARQAFDRRELRTTSGLDFQVVYPGLQVGGAGPDFRDAILALPDGRLVRGDVEIHLHSHGWEQHGHRRDPAYDGVLLHVVLVAGGRTYNSQGEPVLTLALGERLQGRPPGEANRLAETRAQLTYVVAPCRGRLPRLQPGELNGLLRSLALERFQAKQAVFEGELAVYEPEQVLYAGLLEALGYSRNREPFRDLARLVPIEAIACARTAKGIEALLLDGAGLSGTSRSLEAFGLPGMRLPPGVWQTVGVRPDNWPARRIGQGAAVLARLVQGGGLVDALLGPLAEAEDWAKASVKRVQASWYEQQRELGPQRADAIAVNVLLPFAGAYGQATCQFGLAEHAMAAWLAYPTEGG
ncbi:MAG: DUF2851 family protein, partial [Chloroflexi bacterium]|nr:DUF2851 family protein [Chloroflexota bacterium]